MPNLIALYRLQQADSQLEEFSSELSRLNAGGQGSAELEEAKSALEETRGKKREAERLQKDAELKLLSLESEKRKVEEKLFSGKVTNSKELEGYQRDLTQLVAQRGKLDDQVLRGMDSLESLGRDLQAKEAIVQEAQSREAQDAGDRQERIERLARQLEELKTRKESFLASIDELTLEQYHQLKERKGGIAVAKIQRMNCSACFMRVPDGIIKAVRALELETCTSCGRILYFDKEQ